MSHEEINIELEFNIMELNSHFPPSASADHAMNKVTVELYKFQQIQMITAHMRNRKKKNNNNNNNNNNLLLQSPNALTVYLKSDVDGAMPAFSF
jgi:hypothetical protein